MVAKSALRATIGIIWRKSQPQNSINQPKLNQGFQMATIIEFNPYLSTLLMMIVSMNPTCAVAKTG